MNLLRLYRRRQYTNVYNMYKVLAVYYRKHRDQRTLSICRAAPPSSFFSLRDIFPAAASVIGNTRRRKRIRKNSQQLYDTHTQQLELCKECVTEFCEITDSTEFLVGT